MLENVQLEPLKLVQKINDQNVLCNHHTAKKNLSEVTFLQKTQFQWGGSLQKFLLLHPHFANRVEIMAESFPI